MHSAMESRPKSENAPYEDKESDGGHSQIIGQCTRGYPIEMPIGSFQIQGNMAMLVPTHMK